MTFTNNATRLLSARKVNFIIHEYDYDSGIHSAVDVAAAIQLPQDSVFKTLVAIPDAPKAKPVLALIPGPKSLDLKKLAKAVRVKKVRMASHAQAESLTGLLTGGISPLALMNKGFRVIADSSISDHETIAVSAGQRGVNLELSHDDLISVTGASLADLCV